MTVVDEAPAGVRSGSTFRSLRVRNFRLFFVGQLISQVGNWLRLVAMSLLVLELTDSGIALGVLAACQFGPVLVIGAWAGLVADRSDKRRLLVRVQSLAILVSFALAAIAWMPDPPVLALYGVALLGGVATAFDNPARRAFVVEMVAEAEVPNAVSLNSALMTGSRVVGPALAGLLIHTVGYGWTFFLDGVSYLAVIAGLLMMRPAELRPTPVTPRGRGQVVAGLRYVRTVPELFVPLVMMALIGTFAFNFPTVMPLFVTRSLGGTISTFTIIYSVISLGSLAGALVAARRSAIDVRLVNVSAFGFGISMLLLAVSPNVAVTYPIGLLVGATSIGFMTSSTAIVQVRADPTMRGRVLALQAIVFLGSTPVGGPILGWVAERYGARTGVALGGVATLAAAAYGVVAMRRARAAVAAVSS